MLSRLSRHNAVRSLPRILALSDAVLMAAGGAQNSAGDGAGPWHENNAGAILHSRPCLCKFKCFEARQSFLLCVHMRLSLKRELLSQVHGDEVVADSSQKGGLSEACATYKAWLAKTFPGKK